MATSGQVFTISGISGEFLKDHDLIGKQDPYVIFEHGHQKVETSVSKLRACISRPSTCASAKQNADSTRTLFYDLALLQSKARA